MGGSPEAIYLPNIEYIFSYFYPYFKLAVNDNPDIEPLLKIGVPSSERVTGPGREDPVDRMPVGRYKLPLNCFWYTCWKLRG
tara:strand:- start:62 stop:307 length:246 start_codon:yes stop_codon:yes gene_type:complete